MHLIMADQWSDTLSPFPLLTRADDRLLIVDPTASVEQSVFPSVLSVFNCHSSSDCHNSSLAI